MTSDTTIVKVDVSAYTVPTDAPEGDGTFEWDRTTLVVCEVHAAGVVGFGYTYGNQAAGAVAEQLARKCLVGQSAFEIPKLYASMVRAVRNDGSRGIASIAISALDVALWDLKAKLLQVAVVDLLGAASESVAIYGSGGFTTYSNAQLSSQLAGWVEQGIRSVKMKVGARPEADVERVRVARSAIGPGAQLFVDANGAHAPREAIAWAERFAQFDVAWFEEPVSSDDLDGMRMVRERAPHGMEIAAGEYGYDALYFRRMIEARAVDVVQLDATRCKGYTGFLQGAAVAESFGCPMSAHCAPSLHMHVACAVPGFRHVEYFHDHARIERMLFDGFVAPVDGRLCPDRSRHGLGLALKRADAERFLVWKSR